MAILKVARLGHPVLRAKVQALTPAEIASRRVQRLIDDMFETMQEYAGIGLAAPQVHQSVRVFVAGTEAIEWSSPVEDGERMPLVALVNPEVEAIGSEVTEGWEGCLSIPDIRGRVRRAERIRVRAYDRKGRRIELQAAGLPARVIQHETDHLDGVLFFDRMTSFESLAFMEEYQRFWTKHDDEA